MQQALVKIGGNADITITDISTGKVTQEVKGLTNSLYSNLTDVLFKGIASPKFSIGESDSDVNSTTGLLNKPIPSTAKITTSSKKLTRVSEGEVTLSHVLNIHVTNQLDDGVSKYIREMGFDGFDRIVVKTSRGVKYGLMVDKNSVIDIVFTINVTFKVTSPTVSIRVKDSNKVFQTLDCTQRIHINPDLKWFEWNTLLSGTQLSFMRLVEVDNKSLSVDVTKDTTQGYTPENINVSSPSTNTLVFEHNYNIPKNTTTLQLRATLGYSGVWLSLTPSGKFLLPNELNNVKVQVGIK